MKKIFYAREAEVNSTYDTNYEFWIENFGTDFVIAGNKHFSGHCENTIFENVLEILENGDMIDEVDIFDTNKEDSVYISHADIYSDFLEGNIDDEKACALDKAFDMYYDTRTEKEGLCEVLTILTGSHWDYNLISGVCQGDWIYIYYNADVLSDDDIEKIGIDYFGMGNGWMISTTENAQDDDDAFYIYTYGWNDEGIRAEILDAIGWENAEVLLSKIDGYRQVANYSNWY